jgi:hypothetical protein
MHLSSPYLLITLTYIVSPLLLLPFSFIYILILIIFFIGISRPIIYKMSKKARDTRGHFKRSGAWEEGKGRERTGLVRR